MSNGFLFVISGPSGVGKTVLCGEMLKRFPEEVVYSVSATSRLPRRGEKNGRDYFFYRRDDFESAIKENQFAEWAIVHGNFYGTPKFFLDRNLEASKHVLMNIDVQGALKIKASYPQAILIFILPPSFEILEERLRKRNQDSEDVLQQRLRNAKDELEFQEEYSHVVTNDDLEKSSETLKSILAKYIFAES